MLLLAVLAALFVIPLAHADGDPASDYLLSQPVFIPPDAGVPDAYGKQLTKVLADAKARGYETRVALISTKYDMGLIPQLYKQPKQYARFLGQELLFVYKGRLLVVMPNGIGAAKAGKAAPEDQAVVDRLPRPGPSGRALASTATKAVVRLAGTSGVVVPVPPLSGDTGTSKTRDRIVILVAAAAVLGLLAGAMCLWRRLRGART